MHIMIRDSFLQYAAHALNTTGVASYMRIVHHTTLKHDTLTLIPLFGVMESDKHGPTRESVTHVILHFRGDINHVQ